MKNIPIFLAALSALFLAGCRQTPGTQGPTNVPLVYWGLQPAAVFEPLIAEYQKEHPTVTITYRQQPAERYRARLSSRLKSKGQAEMPDMVNYHNGWLPMLTEVLSPAPDEVTVQLAQDYPPVVRRGVESRGTSYGVPLSLDGLTLLVNEELLTKEGVAVPKDWEEFEKAAARLTKRGDDGAIQIAGAAIGTTGNIEHASELVGVMLLQTGVDLSKQTAPANDQRRIAEVLSFYTRLAKGGQRVWDDKQDPSLTAFAGGRAAMIFAPVYRIPEVLGMTPTLRVKAVPIPQLTGKLSTKQAVSWGSFWIEGVVATSAHKKEAWDFLLWLSRPEQLFKLSGEQAKVTQFALAYPRLSMLPRHLDDRYLSAIAGQAPTMRTLPLYSATKDEGINEQLSRVLLAAVDAVAEGREAEDAARQLERDFTQTLAQYRP